MSKKTLEKTWVAGGSRGTTTFNAPGTLTIPYGRYKATLDGRGGTGGANTAATWNTNYNVAYPIANQPIANQPGATWNTNYNVAYPIANRPIANQPAASWNTNYNVAYPIANQPAYYVAYWCVGIHKICLTDNQGWQHCWEEYLNGPDIDYICHDYTHDSMGPGSHGGHWVVTDWAVINGWNTNYNVAYPIANQPAATWNTNYNTNYNVAYPIANQPVATYSVGPAGTPITIFGVTMPGAPGGGSTATPISPTPISYYTKPDGTSGEPDNASYPVTVPTGGQVVFKIE